MGNELQVMGLNIAICDDEKVIREQIKELAEKKMPGVCAGLYETGDALLAAGKQFDVAAFHYLLKPVEEDKFHEVLHWAERELGKRKKQRRETVFIKTRNRSFSLEKDSILYIESRGKKVEIHTTGATVEAYASMNEMEGQLGCG